MIFWTIKSARLHQLIQSYQISESDTKKIYGIVSALGGQYRLKIEQDITHFITLDCKGVSFV